MDKPIKTALFFTMKKHPCFGVFWRRERDLNPCYPYGGKHDFESCAFDRSAISAFVRTTSAHCFYYYICL